MEQPTYTPPEAQPEDRVARAMRTLETGYERLADSDQMKDFLKFAASFYRYSAQNQLMIWVQRPSATMVAGYKQWQQKHERTVRRGERGMQIWAPTFKKAINEETGDEQRVLRGFIPVTVFDLNQTEGKPVPQRIRPTLIQNSSVLGESLIDYTTEYLSHHGVPVFKQAAPDSDSAYGQYIPGESPKIYVRPGMSSDMTAKTTLHEAGHYLADHKLQTPVDEREAVAEGSATIAAEYFGLDTTDYSLKYIINWCDDPKKFREYLPTVQRTAQNLIDGIELVQDDHFASEHTHAHTYARDLT